MVFKYKGATIFYTDEGKGQPVILLHGFLENSKIWQPFLPELSKKNRVICMDLLGHGKSDCLGYVHTMELMAEIVEALIASLNLLKPTIIGHSMGGYVALAYAEKNPDNIAGFCLMNSTAYPDDTEKQKNRDRAINAVKQNHKTFIKIAISNLFRPKNRTIFSVAIEAITKDALKTPLQGIIAALEGMKIRKDRTSILQYPGISKMLIAGKNDPILNYSQLIKQTENTDTKLVTLADGHMSHIENSKDFLIYIMHFIEKNNI